MNYNEQTRIRRQGVYCRGGPMTATGPIRALVVDDSEFFAEMTAATLTEEHDIEATFETNA